MAKDRLNLTVERAVIERARRYSERHGTSISRLVSGFLANLPAEEPADAELTPAVRRLVGIGSGEADREAYRRHLREKHGG